MTPVIVIVIVPELEFDDAELVEPATSIVRTLSFAAGSAAPGEEPPPKNRNIAKTKAKHRNLTTRPNVLSSHPVRVLLTAVICFPKKFLSHNTPTATGSLRVSPVP